MFGGSRENNCFREFTGVDFGELKRALSVGYASIPPFQLDQMVQTYDACVRRVDEELGVLLDRLSELGIHDETAVIVTADHGEEFLDHGGIGHGQGLLNELIHVPLVASVPGHPGPVRYPHPVSHTDLADTVLNLAGINDNLGGCDLFTATDSDRPIFAERRKRKRYSHIIRKGRWKLHRYYKFKIPSDEFDPGETTQEMLDKYRHKVVLELYDLAHDPGELNDLADEPRCADVKQRLECELDRWWQDMTASARHEQADPVEMDPRVVERLRDLGYIE